MSKLYIPDESGGFIEAKDLDICKAAEHCTLRSLQRGAQYLGPKDIKAALPALLAHRPYETFCVAFLDGNCKLIAFEEMFRGTIDQVSAYPREILKRALELNASNIIAVHNHPCGGLAKASSPDISMTGCLMLGGKLLGIDLLDHYIVGQNRAGDIDVCSMLQGGHLNPQRMREILDEGLKIAA